MHPFPEKNTRLDTSGKRPDKRGPLEAGSASYDASCETLRYVLDRWSGFLFIFKGKCVF